MLVLGLKKFKNTLKTKIYKMNTKDPIEESLLEEEELLEILDRRRLNLVIEEAKGRGTIRLGNSIKSIDLAIFVDSNYKWFSMTKGLDPSEERFLSVSEYNKYLEFIERSLKALGYTRR